MTATALPPYGALTDAALGWLHAHRSRFALDEAVLEPDVDAGWTWKPLGELAQICGCVQHHGDPRSRAHRLAAELLRFAWDQVGGGELLLRFHRSDPFATYPLELYAAFAWSGLRHTGYERFAARVTDNRNWTVLEQLPTRRMGVLNSARHAGLPPRGAPRASLDGTWLGGLPEPWAFEVTAGYALTHTVFHLTDWGRTPTAVPADVADYLVMWLPAWLDSCVQQRQWDLCCELLVVAASLPEPLPPSLTEQAWSALAEARDDTTGALVECGPAPVDEPEDQIFRGCYHSTLLLAFASAIAGGNLRRPDRMSP
ncbi:DUF6895 family protein [Pseudonocardia spinosispora]|uniref:DUF6895 family protein n=1 Tax=Pseudonocardia spinosispora TaxID=103441 RepID=UPI0003FF90D9|nr:hypothetical protein [Pseudonocardia spinosispora]